MPFNELTFEKWYTGVVSDIKSYVSHYLRIAICIYYFENTRIFFLQIATF